MNVNIQRLFFDKSIDWHILLWSITYEIKTYLLGLWSMFMTRWHKAICPTLQLPFDWYQTLNDISCLMVPNCQDKNSLIDHLTGQSPQPKYPQCPWFASSWTNSSEPLLKMNRHGHLWLESVMQLLYKARNAHLTCLLLESGLQQPVLRSIFCQPQRPLNLPTT